MNPITEILSQGEEIVSGQTVDSNAAWLSQQLTGLGFDVTRHSACGDRLSDLIETLHSIAKRAECCICTGGLGPTCDDLTREAVSKVCQSPLEFDPIAFETIQQYFHERQRPMPEINRIQAFRPANSTRIDNPVGTAPGFAIKIENCSFAFLPGVPREMKAMFPTVADQLTTRFNTTPKKLITLRSFGIGESAIQQKLNDLHLPSDLVLGYRAMTDEVQIKLLFPASAIDAEVQHWTQQVQARVGDFVFAVEHSSSASNTDLFAVVNQLIEQRTWRAATLESISGGSLAARCQMAAWHHRAWIYKHRQQALSDFGVADGVDADGQLAAAIFRLSGCELILIQLPDQTQQNLVVTLRTPNTHQRYSLPLPQKGLAANYATQYSLDSIRRILLAGH